MTKDLDKWLALNVMGWTIIDELHIKDNNGNYVFDGSPWHPTESISDAFQVVEKMESLGYAFILNSGINIPSGKKFILTGFVGDGNKKFCTEEKTIPLAICLAAKKAVEGVE